MYLRLSLCNSVTRGLTPKPGSWNAKFEYCNGGKVREQAAWAQTIARGQAFVCYSVRPRRRKPMSLLAPESPEIAALPTGFRQVHKHAIFGPWSHMGTCSSGWRCVQIFGVDRAEWLSTVFILDSQSGHKIVVFLSVPCGLNRAGVFGKYQSYFCTSLMENMMAVPSFASLFFPCALHVTQKVQN